MFLEGLRDVDRRRLDMKSCLPIDTTPEKGNARSAWRILETKLGVRLSSIEKDILDFAQTVYLADRHVQRGSGAEALRTIKIYLPMREPDEVDCRSMITLTRHLVSDAISFEILQRSSEEEKDWRLVNEPPTNRNVVSLISGGVDSFGGTIEACEEGFRPIMVSHYTSEAGPAKAVGMAISRQYGGDAPHILIGSLKVGGGTLSDFKVEISMRLRSLLYVSLGAVVSSRLNISQLWMSENGIMTPGIPFSTARVGPYTTRTTHPRFVEQFAEWFSKTTGSKIEIMNPLAFSTKAEIVKNIERRGLSSDLGSTVSCFRRQLAKRHGSGHCGYCVPCIIRRTAFLAAGMEKWDDPAGYFLDCFDFSQLPEDGKADMADLASFATDFRNMTAAKLLFRYIDLLNLGSDEKVEKTIKTLQRFSDEFVTVLEKNAKPNLRKILEIP